MSGMGNWNPKCSSPKPLSSAWYVHSLPVFSGLLLMAFVSSLSSLKLNGIQLPAPCVFPVRLRLSPFHY